MKLALQGDTTIANPAWRYAPAIVAAIKSQIDIIKAEEPESIGGERQVAVALRNEARALQQTHISRARYYYYASCDDLDGTKELAKIACQPRRPASASPAQTPTPEPPQE